ncbi:MAG: nucleotide exchange factor GrpE [Treponema sp.]|jgi:molecular chaperone GrpE|nr:nucleotide exchange factor GrpE [Treponema sp.]
MSKHHVQHGRHNETPDQKVESTASAPDAAGTGSPSGSGMKDPGPGGENGTGSIHVDDSGAALSAEERIAALEAELADARDQFLRKTADFENFRKRMNREKQDAIEFANQSLLLDIIPVIDDFERALKSAGSSRDFTSLYEGIDMIEKRLSSQLESKWGLKRFSSGGEPFDPNRHEAIMVEKSAGVTEPVVGEDFLKGYILKDRVIRNAKVKVLMPESGADSGQAAEGRNGNSGTGAPGSVSACSADSPAAPSPEAERGEEK